MTCYFCKKEKENLVKVNVSHSETIMACPVCIDKLGFKDFLDDMEDEDYENIENKTEVFKSLTPVQIKEMLDEVVIGQDHAKKVLATEVYKHYVRINNKNKLNDMGKTIRKNNIILTGLSGTGKTFLAKSLADILNVPFHIADATALTEAGYVGDDVENILLQLLINSDYDVERAEKGIVFIDEIDKIARKGRNVSITRDVSGEGVQQALLKIIEGNVVRVPMQGGRKHPNAQMYEIDTTDILFIVGGAFEGIEDVVKEREKEKCGKRMGFNASANSSFNNDISLKELRSKITKEDIINFGIIPEFMGRFPQMSNLLPLELDDLISILKNSKKSIIKDYETYFELEGKSLKFTDEALESIAQKALDKKTGARELQSIISDIMLELEFKMPSSRQKKYVITKNDILGQENILEKKPA